MNLRDKRIVVKIGTSTLTHESGHINIRRFEELTKVLSDLHHGGAELIIVSSGAIAVGMGKVGLKQRPFDIPGKQAMAAIGQCELMQLYDTAFHRYNLNVAQMLLTKDVFDHSERKLHVTNTLKRLLEMRVIPIINENDTVAIDEIVIGDNDTLSALVALVSEADSLVVLSDIDGVYTDNPRTNPEAKLIREIDLAKDNVDSLANGPGSSRGTGGMATKLEVAKLCYEAGIKLWIINGSKPSILYDWMDGFVVGTYFRPKGVSNELSRDTRENGQEF